MQARSLLEMSLLAGALRGQSAVGTKAMLRELVQHEIEDTYLLTEKLAALGGDLRLEPAPVSTLAEDPDRALAQLLDHEREAVAALHAVIPHSGQEPRSEALEHLLEHVIMRKQQQVRTFSGCSLRTRVRSLRQPRPITQGSSLFTERRDERTMVARGRPGLTGVIVRRR